MERKEFYDELCKGIVSKLNEEGYNVTGEVKNVTKNNGVVHTGIQFRGEGNVQPVVYMEAFYEQYEKGSISLEAAIAHGADIYERGMSANEFHTEDITDYAKVRDRLFVCVRNAEKNAETLKDIPHEIHEDLVEMYRIQMNTSDGSVASVLISNQLMKELGVDQKTLKTDAWESMKANNPGRLQSMTDVLMELLGDHYGQEEGEAMVEAIGAEGAPMYIYTNQDKLNGAVYMLDKDAMNAVAEKFGESFTILPSSIHECIIIPESVGHDYAALQEMVREVNATQMAPEEILSDNVYRFDKDTQQLSIAEDGPVQMVGIQQM